jgi:hypothetical protein
VPVALFICLIIYLYATRPLVTLAPSIFNLVLVSAILYGVLWVSNKRRKLFAPSARRIPAADPPIPC